MATNARPNPLSETLEEFTKPSSKTLVDAFVQSGQYSER